MCWVWVWFGIWVWFGVWGLGCGVWGVCCGVGFWVLVLGLGFCLGFGFGLVFGVWVLVFGLGFVLSAPLRVRLLCTAV